jgi:hypothetical protein
LDNKNLVVDMNPHAQQSLPQQPAALAGNDFNLFSFAGQGEGKRGIRVGLSTLIRTAAFHMSSCI